MHHEFIHKLFLRRNVDAVERKALIESYVDCCIEWAADLRRAEQMLEPALKGRNAESARFQLLSLRHLCRLVKCEASSARSIRAEIRSAKGKLRLPARAPAAPGAPFSELRLSPGRRVGHA